jgi:AraC-like DNA-binding protein
MNSICRFIPAKSENSNLKTVHFVFETEFQKLEQPFLHPIHYMFLVTRGKGEIQLDGEWVPLEVGTLFFNLPGQEYYLRGNDEFSYMYISFMGARAIELLDSLDVQGNNLVFEGFESEIPFWRSAIQRIHQQNANILTEGVLLYTLSFLSGGDNTMKPKSGNLLDNILQYIDNHYDDPDLSIKQVADIYAYTEKYLSHLFKSHMNINWSTYLNRLRVQKALELIGKGEYSISELAIECGYRDPMYFSKVFKKMMGVTPRGYIDRQSEEM